MSNHFRQTAWLALAAPAPLWSIASDVHSLLEGAFGENWKRANLKYTASTHTGINFAAPDLPSLRSQTEKYGGPLRDVSIDANLHVNGSLYMASANVWASDNKAKSVSITWYMPMRVDAESFRYAIEHSVVALRRRKRWKGTGFDAQALKHESDATQPSPRGEKQLIYGNSMRLGIRRWFVRSRDSIIIGLSTGLIAAIAIIGFQLGGILPTP